MSLLDTASLIVTPNAYKESKLYSVIPSDGSGDLSVTRATTATRVNSAGLVELTPYNLATYSEQFDNAAWSKNNGALAINSTTAPNGTITADRFTPNTSNAQHVITQAATLSASTTYTLSLYVKPDGYNTFAIRMGADAIWSGGVAPTVTFNTVTMTAAITTGTPTYTITNVGDGWYRCSITATTSTGGSSGPGFYPNQYFPFAGDGTSGIYLWGAQLVEGTNALPYQKTETRLNIPRLDYSNGTCPSLLVEPQRTNLALYSQQFDNSPWATAGGVVTPNFATSPSGLTDAELVNGTLFQTANLTIGATYTLSVWAKLYSLNIPFYLFGNSFASSQQYILSFSEYQRVSFTFTATESSNIFGFSAYSDALIYGAQLEAGSYATSYIPTTSASVTRNVDILQRTNVYTNGWITSSGGTWYGEIKNNKALIRDASSYSFALKNAAAFNSGIYLRQASGAAQRIVIAPYSTGAIPSGGAYTTSTDTVKFAAKWDGTNYNLFVNGVKVVSSIPYTQTLFEFLECPSGRDIPLFINAMALFPEALTDEQLEALTTI